MELRFAAFILIGLLLGAHAQDNNGVNSGNNNVGSNNGGINGNYNDGSGNGAQNGNDNLSSNNGNKNGNNNYAGSGSYDYSQYLNPSKNTGAGNGNGNNNQGQLNGGYNGNYNANNQNQGNGNGNNNIGLANGIGNGNFGAAGASNNGNGNGNGNFGVANGVGNGNFQTGSGNGNNNGNGNVGSGNGNGNGNAAGVNGQGSGNGNGAINPALFAGQNNGNGVFNGNGNGQAHGKGDPIFTGFAGRSFEFFGEVGQTYNIISERFHQLAATLKLGVMWDHNGTYMGAVGFLYRGHQVAISAGAADQLAVELDGKVLAMEAGREELDLVVESPDPAAELTLTWQAHRAGLGQAVELQTEMLNVVVWMTPAGTLDEGGVVQPSYLNFDITLLASPSGPMTGIVGETFARLQAGQAAVSDPSHKLFVPDDYEFHGTGGPEEYIMVNGLFDTAHRFNEYGSGAAVARRSMAEVGMAKPVAFPLHAGGRGHVAMARRMVVGGRKGRF